MDSMSNIGNDIRSNIMNCIAFITLGTCYFGKYCHYNHPDPEEVAADRHGKMSQSSVTPCKFFSHGVCKYGASCHFSHVVPDPRLHLNALGLPKRLGAITCAFYMRNGICGFGVACKYDHPEPVNQYPLQGYGSYAALEFAEHQNEPIGNGYGWNGDGNQYVHWPAPNFYYPSAEFREYENGYHGVAHDGNANGNQYNQHPNAGWNENQARTAVVMNEPVTLSDVGLPLRPGKRVCRNYESSGLCKYGPRCKFDHPIALASNGEGSTMPVSGSKTANASNEEGSTMPVSDSKTASAQE